MSSKHCVVARPPRPPRQVSQAPRPPRQVSQTAAQALAARQAARPPRQAPRPPRQAAQAAQTGVPGRPDTPPGRSGRPVKQSQTAPQPPKQASQAAPVAGAASRNAIADETMSLSAKPCSCRHCSCRQNTALWPCQTGPRPSRQAPRPPRQAPQAAPAVGTASKNVLVDKTAPGDNILLLSTLLLSTKHSWDNLQD